MSASGGSTYYCKMTVPDANSPVGAQPSDMVCSTIQPVQHITNVHRTVDMTSWLELAAMIAVVLMVLIVAVWRYNVVNMRGYKSRKQIRLEHEQAMAQIEVERLKAEAQRQQANDTADDFGIGATTWPGIAKLMEEAGEVIQVCSKLIATGGRTDHWSGDDLSVRLVEELGDLQAAIRYVHAHNGTARYDAKAFHARSDEKFALFQHWHHEARRGNA